jgi:multidrug resistance efflux pump
VRLAQRIPVRVTLDEIPADFRMIAGRTATVSVRGIGPKIGKRAASETSPASAPAPTSSVSAPASGASQ